MKHVPAVVTELDVEGPHLVLVKTVKQDISVRVVLHPGLLAQEGHTVYQDLHNPPIATKEPIQQ